MLQYSPGSRVETNTIGWFRSMRIILSRSMRMEVLEEAMSVRCKPLTAPGRGV